MFSARGPWMLLYFQKYRADVLVPESFRITSATVGHPSVHPEMIYSSVDVLEFSIRERENSILGKLMGSRKSPKMVETI